MSEKKEQHDKDFSDFQSPHEASIDRLVTSIDLAYHHPWRMVFRSFLYGFMGALGAAFGTVLIGILSVYLFKIYGGVQLLAPFVDQLQQVIVQAENKTINTISPGGQSSNNN